MNLINTFNNACLTIDFNNPDINNGNSFLPFISFAMFFAGLVIIFIGIILVNSAKKEWNLFYAPQDKYTDDMKAKRKSACLKGRIVYSIGFILFVASFFVK
jgi:hypothetical protein